MLRIKIEEDLQREIHDMIAFRLGLARKQLEELDVTARSIPGFSLQDLRSALSAKIGELETELRSLNEGTVGFEQLSFYYRVLGLDVN